VASSSSFSKISSALKRFFKNESANVTMMAGLAAIPMFLASGAAVDMVRVNREQATFQAAIDAAVLAIAADPKSAIGGLSGTALETRIQELEGMAREYVEANYSAESGNANAVTIDVASSNQAVQITAYSTFPTTIMSFAGVYTMELKAFAEVQKAMRPIELVMVMDTTGSMDGAKMAGAKAAARKLLEILYGGTLAEAPQSEYIRASLVPFALAVRLNQGAYDFNMNWIDTTGTNPLSKLNFNSTTWNNFMAWSQIRNAAGTAPKGWNGCVEARARSSAGSNLIATDVAPVTGTPATLFPAYFNPDQPRNSSNTGASYGPEYVNTSGTPNENSGLSTTQINDNTTAGLLYRQKNQAKYVNKPVPNEVTGGTLSTMNSNVGPWTSCAKSTIVPMTYKRENIENGITAMAAYGGTNIAEGLAWGLRAVSPSEPFTRVEGAAGIPADFIAAYNSPRWRKVMVLMSDGENDVGTTSGSYTNSLNGTNYSAYGRGLQSPVADNRFGTTTASAFSTTLNNDMATTCTLIKDSGVEMYTTFLRTTTGALTAAETAAENRMIACATDADHYKRANGPDQLISFFDHIGQETLNKMIFVSK
jgi:Mg-chelatase subunit ChlD